MEKKLLVKSKIQSLLILPIADKSNRKGFIGLFSYKPKRTWDENEIFLLKFLSDVFISALERSKSNLIIILHEKLLTSITQSIESFFINSNWEENVINILNAVGTCTGVNRIMLGKFNIQPDSVNFNFKYGWTSEKSNINELIHNYTSLNLLHPPLDKLYNKTKSGEIIYYVIDELNASVKKYFKKQGITSILFLPIFVNSEIWGGITLTDINKKLRKWHEFELETLKLLARFIGLSYERILTMKALSEEKEKFSNIFQYSNDPIVIINTEGNVLLANDKFWSEGYFKKNDRMQKPYFFKIIHTSHRNIFKKLIQNLDRSVGIFPKEFIFRKHNGEMRNIEVNSSLLEFNQNKAILIIMRDITERKEMQKKLLEATIQTQEKERQRFAEDLHDELGPMLSGIKLYISELNEKNNNSKQKKYIANYLEEMVDEAVQKTRILSNNLMPNVLIDYGLEKGLNSFIDKLNRINNFNIHFNFTDNKIQIENTLEIIIYRMVNELINNSIKHSRANNFDINILIKQKSVHIVYKDDGIGFDLKQELKYKQGIGLTSILNRLETINGKYKFVSKNNKGIRFEFHIPLY